MKLATISSLKPLDLTPGRPLRSSGPALSTRLAPPHLNTSIQEPKGFAATAGAVAAPDAQHQALLQKTRTWVAQTFYGTLLKQMHESPFKSEVFDGGRGGKAFNELYDQRLVEHMARGAGSKLVNSIVRHIEAKLAYAKQGRPDNGNNRRPSSRPRTSADRLNASPGVPGSSRGRGPRPLRPTNGAAAPQADNAHSS